MTKNNLSTQYATLILKYMKVFFDKQELYEDIDGKREYPRIEWIGQIGDMCEFSDYFFNFSDIKYDVDNEIQKGVIFDWYDHTLECGMKDNYHTVNYSAYLMGARCSKKDTKLQYWFKRNKWRWCCHKWTLKDCNEFSFEVCDKCGKNRNMIIK